MSKSSRKTFYRSLCQCGSAYAEDDDVDMVEIVDVSPPQVEGIIPKAEDGAFARQPMKDSNSDPGNELQSYSQRDVASEESKEVPTLVDRADDKKPGDGKLADPVDPIDPLDRVDAPPEQGGVDAGAAGGNAAADDDQPQDAVVVTESEKIGADKLSESSPATEKEDSKASGDELDQAFENLPQANASDETEEQVAQADLPISSTASEIIQPDPRNNSMKQVADATAGSETLDSNMKTEDEIETSNLIGKPTAADSDTKDSTNQSLPESLNHDNLTDSGRKRASNKELEGQKVKEGSSIALVEESGNPKAQDATEDAELFQELEKASVTLYAEPKSFNSDKALEATANEGADLNQHSTAAVEGKKDEDFHDGARAEAVKLQSSPVQIEQQEVHLREQLKDFNSYLKLEPIVVGYDHTVCVSVGNYKEGTIPQPYRAKKRERRDAFHVRMPFSSEHEFPAKEGEQKRR